MKKLFFFSATVMLFYSCNAPCPEDTKGKENIALVEKYIDAVEAGDYATIESMIADNYVGHGPSVSDTINKQDGLASWKHNLENLYEKVEYLRSRNLPMTITEGEHLGEWVTNLALVSIKYKDGRGPVKLFVSTVYKIENGKISNTFTAYNENDVLEQLGMN